MNLRPYQERAVEFVLTKKRAFVVAPAGSGKTIIAAAAAAKSWAWNIGWLANTREQVQQAEDAAGKFGVNITTFCAAAQPNCSRFDLLIVDEAHHMPASTWSATIGTATGAVWGFSATPWTGDVDRDNALRHFFKEFITIPREEVLAGGNLTHGKVIVHDLESPGQFSDAIESWTAIETEKRCRRFRFIPREEHERRARWQATAEAIRTNAVRNDTIVEIANESQQSVLVLVATIEHGEQLAARINGSVLVHAKLPKSKRAAAIAGFRSGEIPCLIATSLADEGLDVPRAAVLILAAGGRSAAKLEQRAGRVMRPHEDKEFGIVHDFSDEGSRLGHSQWFARAKTYKKLGYNITRAKHAVPA